MPRLLLLALALAFTACSDTASEAPPERAEQDESRSGPPEEVGFGGPVRGEFDTAATDSAGTVEIGVTSEVLYLRLTDSARAEVEQEIAEDMPEEGDGLGGLIGGVVEGVVEQALATVLQFDLASVEALRYEDGRLFIALEGTTDLSFDDKDIRNDGLPMDASEAVRLVEAFEKNRP